VIRQRQLIAIVFAVLLVGLLYPSPAYAKSTAGRMLSPVQVKAGTPVGERVPGAAGHRRGGVIAACGRGYAHRWRTHLKSAASLGGSASNSSPAELPRTPLPRLSEKGYEQGSEHGFGWYSEGKVGYIEPLQCPV
jgi:hypothetical protein